MADDWIKMRKELSTDPAVITIMQSVSLDEFQTIGRLHKLWSWADSHSDDGTVHGVTSMWIDTYVDCPGFASAMERALWLRVTSNGVSFLNYERHMSENAKKRAQTALRVSKYRERERNANSNADTLPDKSRIDKNRREESKIREVRHRHGEYKHVMLTDREYGRLEADWGEPELRRMIAILDEGIEMRGYKYKNHNLAIQAWKKREGGNRGQSGIDRVKMHRQKEQQNEAF